MANLYVGGSAILRVAWYSNTPLLDFNNIYGVVKPAGTNITQSLTNTVGSAVKSAFTSSGLAAQLHVGVALNKVGLRDFSSPNQVEFLDTGAAVPGTGTGDPLPMQTAFAITLKTALAGSRYRGRSYLGGFTEAANDTSGLASTATQTAAVNFVVALSAALTASGLTLGVLSRPSDKVTIQKTTILPDGSTEIDQDVREARPGAITPVTSIIARNRIWDTMRSRATGGSGSTLRYTDMIAADLT